MFSSFARIPSRLFIIPTCNPLSQILLRTTYHRPKQYQISLEKIKSIDVTFSGMAEGTTGMREFFRQINGKNISASNPDCKKNLVINHDGIIPTITIEWNNKTTTVWEAQYMSLIDIFQKIRLTSRQVDFEEHKADWENYKKENLKKFKEIIKEKYNIKC